MQEAGSRTEKIGQVTLDYTYYPGEDYYCDGAVEDEILEIVQNNPAECFEKIIREKKSWPVLYHLSSIRGNIVDWIPFTGNEKVLEIGAGPGAITGVLAKKCAQVTCVELSRKRSMINAYRHKDCGNVKIMVGNFEDIEPHLPCDYDYIFLIGVFEYAGSYIKAEDPFREELRRISAHLRKTPAGRIVIAIENRLGLKYFAGCKEDHSARYFDGIENYPGEHPATTFSRPALEKILRGCGMNEYSFYYPYPDYKFMSSIYSDTRLPDGSELTDNIRNFDMDRLLLFDEHEAYEGITRDGLYPVFANSFEVIVGDPLPVSYAKFSNDRAPCYRIRTELAENPRRILKYPLTKEAQEHVRRMAASYEKLRARFEPEEGNAAAARAETASRSIRIAPCRLMDDGSVCFDYVQGEPLETLLDACLLRHDKDGFLRLIEEYRERLSYRENLPAADQDMTFANLLVDEDVWTAVDYEWETDRCIPVNDLLYRALLLYRLENKRRARALDALLGEDFAEQICDETEGSAKRLVEEERRFQRKVTGGMQALGDFRAQTGMQVIIPAQLQTKEQKAQVSEEKKEQAGALTAVRVYYDTGKGYNEDEAYFVSEQYEAEGMIRFTVPVEGNVRCLRVDPALCPCVVLLRNTALTEEDGTVLADTGAFQRYLKSNAVSEKPALVFTTDDPNMEWDLKKFHRRESSGKTRFVHFTLQMCGLPSTMADAMR